MNDPQDAAENTNRATPTLAEYQSKRDFARTPEPVGGTTAPDPDRSAYCVQKHAASRLHYDFRLEVQGVLKSWAVPKGPSLDPADKRLAVMTEDHPLEYLEFEGTIPEGEYGGGTVMLWDVGWWEIDNEWGAETTARGRRYEPVTDAAAALAKGELKIRLHGKKLTGSWALAQMKGRGEENWLLLKHRDDAARPGVDIETMAPDSVATGRSLEQIRQGGEA